MSNRELPCMPWYPDQFAASTEAWSFAEAGLYRCLLDAQWKLGALPAEHERLARIAKLSVEEFESYWKVVRPKFSKTTGGRLLNKRLEAHRLSALNRKTELAAAGHRGGKASAAARLQAGLKAGSSQAPSRADSNRQRTLHSSHSSDKNQSEDGESSTRRTRGGAAKPRRKAQNLRTVVKALAADKSMNGSHGANEAAEPSLGAKVRALAEAGNQTGDIVRILAQHKLTAEQVERCLAGGEP